MQELSPEPDPSRAPLFQVIFTLQNAPARGLRAAGARRSRRVRRRRPPRPSSTSRSIMAEAPAAVSASRRVQHRSLRRRPPSTRMIGHLATLLAGDRRRPGAALRDLPCSPTTSVSSSCVAVERRPRPRTRSTRASTSSSRRQADATPEATGARRRRRAADVPRARRPRQPARAPPAPARRRPRVGGRALRLALAPRWWSALLGVLKAGGAYLPLDPDATRRTASRELVRARGARVVVSEDRFARRLPASASP